MNRRMRGSITVFASLMLMLIAQFLFTLIECARVTELNKVAKMNSGSLIESSFAEYCAPLWKNCDILAADISGDSGSVNPDSVAIKMKQLTTSNFAYEEGLFGKPYVNFLRLDLDSVSYNSYTLLTDYNGRVYEALCASYMKENMPATLLNKLSENNKKISDINSDEKSIGDKIANAIESLKNHNSEENKDCPKKLNPVKKGNTETNDSDSTLSEIESIRNKGILGLVLPSGSSISTKSINKSDRVSKRTLQKGKNPQEPASIAMEKILYEMYLLNHFSNYTSTNKGNELNYELEYIVSGKDSDKDNLKSAVEKLLIIREAANMAYLVSNSGKNAEALAFATALAGVTANPVIVEAVKMGLIAGWAYCESIMDIRTLLSGDKIPIMKTDATWTSNVKNIVSILKGKQGAKKVNTGFNYTDYLGCFAYLESVNKSACRAMDLQELGVQKQTGYGNFKVDNSICSASVKLKYQYNYMFLSLVSLVSHKSSAQNIYNSVDYSYIQKNK